MKIHAPSRLPALLSLVISVRAITLGRHVFVRHELVEAYPSHRALLRHEAAHVGQWAQLGAIVFLWRYVADFLVAWWRLRDRQAAYSVIRLEQEARTWERAVALHWLAVPECIKRDGWRAFDLPPKKSA